MGSADRVPLATLFGTLQSNLGFLDFSLLLPML
jgi:hypothetical protein